MTLCFADLGNLKTLNDTHGHQTGGSALRKTDSILREYEMKYEGTLGHYGRDEFILVLNDTDTTQEVHAVLPESVEKLNFPIAAKQKAVTVYCSIDACIWNKADFLDVLIAKADKASYDVRRHGKRTYSLFLKGES